MERRSKLTLGLFLPKRRKEIIILSKDDIFDIFELLRDKIPKGSKPYYSKNPQHNKPIFSMKSEWVFSDQTFSNAVFEKFDIHVKNIQDLGIFWYGNTDERGCKIKYYLPLYE